MNKPRPTILIDHYEGQKLVYQDEHDRAVRDCQLAGGAGGGAAYAEYTPIKDEEPCKDEIS